MTLSTQLKAFCAKYAVNREAESVTLDLMEDIVYYTEMTPHLYTDNLGALAVRVYNAPEEAIDIQGWADGCLPDGEGFRAYDGFDETPFFTYREDGSHNDAVMQRFYRNVAVMELCDQINERKFNG